ncbi:apolipoprotein N-acyltransferase [Candidatus Magnetaquicoccus inordinatus]|uniref:apolipoprotein N-acyltransferase n=1 Tax=Candidatus Magnetaquicoccus inordinatus TaxID=2496818 RepID=UPI00102BD519|nr:apolipoprotein N-acyltransferase [Candidatus Magnetaquicoccus inordinatus]
MRALLPSLLALLAGGISIWEFPSALTPFTATLGLTLLLILLSGSSTRQSAWLAFLFGLSHFTLGFSWLLTSLQQFGGIAPPLALLMLVALSALMALYPAMFGALLPTLAPRPHLLPLAAPALWVLCEWLRTHLFTGFSWNLLGYGWNNWENILQIADLGGIYLLSWLMLLPAALFASLWLRRPPLQRIASETAALLLLLLLLSGYGHWRLADSATLNNSAQAAIRVAIVQGNIPQQLKWATSQQQETLERYLRMSLEIPRPVDLVVWPETAMSFFFRAKPDYLQRIAQTSQQIQAPILTGAPSIDRTGEEEPWRYFNSMLLLDESGSLEQRYDKHHLVPFGEFIPFRHLVPATFQKFTEGTEDFSSGPGPVALPWHKGDIGPLICYEAIFPDEVRTLAATGVKWLVNITNDGWFGESAKPQHLAMVRLRAIENRLPMIRAANTGISAVIDQWGRELGRIAANQTDSLVVTVPAGSANSFYTRFGGWWLALWLLLLLLAYLRKNAE